MNKKLERQLNGPGITEVLLGAVLSLALGVVLGAAYLVFTPVAAVKELPKEPVKGVVYYIEGSRDTGKARQAATKLKTLVQGGSVTLVEDELNAMTAPAPVPAAAGQKATPAEAPAASGKTLSRGAPNFRIKDGVLQIGVPVQLSALGFEQKVIFQARGGFARNGDAFQFVPGELYLGSCPLQRLPGVERALLHRLLAAETVPVDLTEVWTKLTDIAVEGSNLRVATQ